MQMFYLCFLQMKRICVRAVVIKLLTPYREIMKSTAKRHGAPLINVPELFTASGLTKEQLFLDEMHPTKQGHKIMGEAMAKILQDADWVNGGSIMKDGDGTSLTIYEDPFIKGASTSSGGFLGPHKLRHKV